MFDFIFRAFYFLRWIYTLIRICHGRENKKKNLELKQKTKQASEIVLLLGGNENTAQ